MGCDTDASHISFDRSGSLVVRDGAIEMNSENKLDCICKNLSPGKIAIVFFKGDKADHRHGIVTIQVQTENEPE
jgi:hypothetical protein